MATHPDPTGDATPTVKKNIKVYGNENFVKILSLKNRLKKIYHCKFCPLNHFGLSSMNTRWSSSPFIPISF